MSMVRTLLHFTEVLPQRGGISKNKNKKVPAL